MPFHKWTQNKNENDAKFMFSRHGMYIGCVKQKPAYKIGLEVTYRYRNDIKMWAQKPRFLKKICIFCICFA